LKGGFCAMIILALGAESQFSDFSKIYQQPTKCLLPTMNAHLDIRV
jgi:hypothetical protein